MNDETEAPPYGGLDLAIPGWASDWPIPVGMTAYQRDVLALMHSNMKPFNYVVAVYRDERFHHIYVHWYDTHPPYPGDRVSLVADNGYIVSGPHSLYSLQRMIASGECVLVDTDALPYRRKEEAERARLETNGRARPLITEITPKTRRSRPARAAPEGQKKLFD